MNLKHLTDKTLISETHRLVREETEITAVILHHFKEIERRKLYCEFGHPSMLQYAIRELNYSEGSALRRIKSARILRDIPEIDEKINDGSLSLSNISSASGFFTRENIKDPTIQRNILKLIENKTARECEKILFSLAPDTPLPKEEIRVVSENYQQIKVNVSDKIFKTMNDVKDLLGLHAINEVFLEQISKEALENITRKRFKLTEKGRETKSTGPTPSNFEKREAFNNAKEKICEKCGGLFLLQEDHRIPKGLGGTNDPSNLRLLCFNCNQRERIKAKL